MSILKTMADYDKVYPGLKEFKMLQPAILAEAEFIKKKGLIMDPEKDKPGMQFRPTGYFVVVKLPDQAIIDQLTNPVHQLKFKQLKLGDRIAVQGVALDPNDFNNQQWTWGDLSKKDRSKMDEEPMTVMLSIDNVVGTIGSIPKT